MVGPVNPLAACMALNRMRAEWFLLAPIDSSKLRKESDLVAAITLIAESISVSSADLSSCRIGSIQLECIGRSAEFERELSNRFRTSSDLPSLNTDPIFSATFDSPANRVSKLPIISCRSIVLCASSSQRINDSPAERFHSGWRLITCQAALLSDASSESSKGATVSSFSDPASIWSNAINAARPSFEFFSAVDPEINFTSSSG